MEALVAAASALVAPPKGILAISEGTAAADARLTAAGVPATAANRDAYREMLISAPGLRVGISGVILDAAAFRQRLADGRPFPAAIRAAGMLPGVAADHGTAPLPGAPGETITEGLDQLASRLRGYAGLGAAFAAWRAVLRIGPGAPSPLALRANAQALGRYAAACQEAALVPVAAVEILAGGRHSLAQAETVTALVLLEVMSELRDYGVVLAATVLKASMVLPCSRYPGPASTGLASTGPASPGEVAAATVRALSGVPFTLAGIAFRCGGQRADRATGTLAAMQRLPHAWPLTFCFGRALTGPALAAWHGDPARCAAGQRALAHRVAMNVAALEGRYTPELDLDPA